VALLYSSTNDMVISSFSNISEWKVLVNSRWDGEDVIVFLFRDRKGGGRLAEFCCWNFSAFVLSIEKGLDECEVKFPDI
jgi:hypothetical protein